LTLLLDRIEETGLVSRGRAVPADRQARFVGLTSRGGMVANTQLDVGARHAATVALALALTVRVPEGVQ
jgi:hypothetical protein